MTQYFEKERKRTIQPSNVTTLILSAKKANWRVWGAGKKTMEEEEGEEEEGEKKKKKKKKKRRNSVNYLKQYCVWTLCRLH